MPPAVPPLFVMSFVEGSALEPLFDLEEPGPTEPAVAERWRNGARTMAALHRIEPASLGLGHEPVVGPDQEIDRWCRLLETVDAALVPGWDDVAGTLRRPSGIATHGDRARRLPAGQPPGGRRATSPAIVDWEIWSIGDPRVDLGWFLVNADPDTYAAADPLRRRHSRRRPSWRRSTRTGSGATVSDLGWFEALASASSRRRRGR